MTHPMNGAPHDAPASPWAPGVHTGYQPVMAPQQGGTGPVPWPAAAPPPRQLPDPQRGRGRPWWVRAGLAVVVAAVAVAGGIIGSALMAHNRPEAAPPAAPPVPVAEPGPSAASIHEQDVRLCTSYIIFNATVPKETLDGMTVLPGTAALRVAMLENPDASPQIRDAMTDILRNYDALMADLGHVRSRGLAQPPAWDRETGKAAYQRAAEVCGRT